jgi:hypothetical protein
MLPLVVVEDGRLAPPEARPDDPAVAVWRNHDGGVAACGHTVDGWHWLHLPGLGSFRLGAAPGAVSAVVPPGTDRERLEDAFRRVVLPMAVQAAGLEVVHASAVRAAGGVLALCGVSETGKSTLACALARRGHPLWADDTVAFDATGEVPVAVALPFRLRLRPAAAAFFGGGSGPAVPAGPGARAPLRAFYLLERVADAELDGDAEALPVPPARAFPALLSHAYCLSLRDPGRTRRMVLAYLAATRRIPVFRLRFRAGLERLPAVLAAVEESAHQPAVAAR